MSDDAREIMRPLMGANERTEAGALQAVFARLPVATTELQEIRSFLWDAESAAKANGRPTDEYRRLSEELDAIIELLQEKLMETIQKETGTRG